MTALITQLVNSGGNFGVGILLLAANGLIATNGGYYITPASGSQADIVSAVNTGAISWASGLGYTISSSDVVSILQPTLPVRTYSNPSRTLNSAFQISTTQDAQVTYAVDIAATLSLTTGQTGTVVLEYADDSGFTTNVVTVQTSKNGNTGTLTLGLGLGQTVTATVSGMIPAGKYTRLRTVNTSGSPTFTFINCQEVTL